MSTPLSVSVRMRYRLERLLGQGGMGSVYRAYDRLTGQPVALKLVHLEQIDAEPPDAKPGPPVSGETQPLSLEWLHPETNTEGAVAARRSSLTKTVAAELRAASPGRSSRVHIAVGSARHRSSNALWARLALAQEFRTLASVRHPHIISVLDYGFAAKSQPFFTMELLENARTLDAARQGLSLQQQALLLTQLLSALSYLHRHGILHRDARY